MDFWNYWPIMVLRNASQSNSGTEVSMRHKLTDSLLKIYGSLSRQRKQLVLVFTDALVFFVAITLAIALRFKYNPAVQHLVVDYWWQISLFIGLKLLVFWLIGVYRPILRYTGLEFMFSIAQGTVISSGFWLLLSFQRGMMPFSRIVLVMDGLLTLVLVVVARLLLRQFIQNLYQNVLKGRATEAVIIYGAGLAGAQLANSLRQEPGYRLVGFIDDHEDLHQRLLNGHRIYSRGQLKSLIAEEGANTLILAMPSIDRTKRREIINALQSLPITIKTVPSLPEILTNKHALSNIRRVDVADLLGREEVLPEPELLSINITGKSVLVTGSGGSIGSQLCREIAHLQPKCLVLFELNEFALYTIDLELAKNFPDVPRVAYLGNVTDRAYVNHLLQFHAVETVYHAAAYKHVPLVEANPAQGIQNNILGTLVMAQCAIASNVKNFVMISTDKAVRPTNVMGTTKRCAELAIQALADLPNCPTCFGIVRFGNVLDSSGSVVPRFRQQIAAGLPLTVTHRDVTRYFMSIPEAVRLVIQAGAMATGGDVFLLEMGEPVRIYDLAEQMIRLSGLEVGKDVEIKITGLRPGEKLYEELLIDPNNHKLTRHPKIFAAHEQKYEWAKLEPMLKVLFHSAQMNDTPGIVRQLQRLVPEYQPDALLMEQAEKSSSKSWVAEAVASSVASPLPHHPGQEYRFH
jgi:FlaA1/EpsC-like NDP-sugar epimerase